MKRLIICLLMSIVIVTGVVYGQSYSNKLITAQKNIDTLLADEFKRFPQEKVYLHLSQGLYLNGDTIWFKAYTTAYGVPSKLSRILHVQLADSAGHIVNSSKLQLKNGVAGGIIPLPGNLASGWYTVKGYTAWMLNFKTYSYFNQQVYVQNTTGVTPPVAAVPAKKTYHIHFYPEGGDLAEGHLCNLAFKATDEKGEPVTISGELYANNKDTAGTLHPLHDGMGKIQFEPKAGAGYTARVVFPDQSVQTIALPAVKRQYLSLRVDALPSTYIRLKMTFSGSNQDREVIIAAVQNNGTSISFLCRLSRGTNIFDIDKGNFFGGIVRVTISNASGIPQAERICFVNKPEDALRFAFTRDSISDRPGGKNNLSLLMTGQDNKPVTGNFSASITKSGFSADSSQNIGSYLLLSSELKGYIHNPAYYFKNSSDSLQQQLDLVMLTSGWRHFTVKGIDSVKLKYAVETTQNITGRVVEYAPGKIKNLNLTLADADSAANFYKVNPDNTGRFFIAGYNTPGDINIYADAGGKKTIKPVKIILDQSIINQTDVLAADSGLVIKTPDISMLSSGDIKYHTDMSPGNKVIALKVISVKDKITSQLKQVIDNHVKHLTADQAYDLDILDTQSLPTMNILDYLPGRIPNLEVLKNNNGVVFHYRGVNSLIAGDEPPTTYVDEVRTDIEDLTTINLTDVALIRFLPPPVWFAPLNGGVNGVLMIYIKNVDDIKKTRPGNVQPPEKYVFKSFAVTREFDMPDYNRPIGNNKPDKRTTLFWRPDMKTDKQGKLVFRYLNPAVVVQYRISVQGVTDKGVPVHFEQTF